MPPLSDCVPGNWYFVVTCKKCAAKDALFRDVSNGKAIIRRTYRNRCFKCQHTDHHDPDEIERYHHSHEPPS